MFPSIYSGISELESVPMGDHTFLIVQSCQSAAVNRLPSVRLFPADSAAAIFFRFAFDLLEVKLPESNRLDERNFHDWERERLLNWCQLGSSCCKIQKTCYIHLSTD